jgi:hypothetical protein
MVGPVLVCLALGVGCGEDGEPGSGHYDPCDTPAAGAMGCPAGAPVTTATQTFTLFDACKKLVTCGILSSDWMGSVSGTECGSSDACKGGQCLPYSKGMRCHYPLLDYAWCVRRFTTPPSTGCTDEEFTDQDIAAMLDCIAKTPCGPLGLPFSGKVNADNKQLVSSKDRELDKITCKNELTTIWTATICDHGLLRYDSQTKKQ